MKNTSVPRMSLSRGEDGWQVPKEFLVGYIPAQPYPQPFGGRNPAMRLTAAIKRINEIRAGMSFVFTPGEESTQMTHTVEEVDTSATHAVVERLFQNMIPLHKR